MAELRIVAVPNGDDVVIAWWASAVEKSLGFAVERQVKGKPATYLETEVPFRNEQKATRDERRPSTAWPIQRFIWTDHLADGAEVRYRVRAVKGTSADPRPVAASEASPWTRYVSATTQSTPGYHFFPNRGIVASQWVDDELDALASASPDQTVAALLKSAIGTPHGRLRGRLAGPVLRALREEFARAAGDGEEIHLALYELRDQELIDLIAAAGPRAHVVLANGAFDAEDPDPNKDGAKQLRAKNVDVTRRMVKPGHFAHNKFVVFGSPGNARVWTGSTNWTPSGLCTQSNHAILVDDHVLADAYLDYWKRLRAAKHGFPANLVAVNDAPGQAANNGPITTRAWFTPVTKTRDLADARALIRGAEQGALFLMFRPGNTKTLIDDIKTLHDRGLFIRGVVNKGFLGSAQTRPTIEFFNKSRDGKPVRPEILLPERLQDDVGSLEREQSNSGPLIHSKTVVLDPFGDHPVVITGSHNLGTKASADNDDNLLIIENAPGIAREFAVYIMTVYEQYQWRYGRTLRAQAAQNPARVAKAAAKPAAAASTWSGLVPGSGWQDKTYRDKVRPEVDFWFGSTKH